MSKAKLHCSIMGFHFVEEALSLFYLRHKFNLSLKRLPKCYDEEIPPFLNELRVLFFEIWHHMYTVENKFNNLQRFYTIIEFLRQIYLHTFFLKSLRKTISRAFGSVSKPSHVPVAWQLWFISLSSYRAQRKFKFDEDWAR